MSEKLIIKNTMADMRNMPANEILSLQGTQPEFTGVKLLGYHEKGDTPAPIIYYYSTNTATEDGGSLVDVTGGKLEHKFSGEVGVQYFGARSGVISTAELQKTINYAIANRLPVSLNDGSYLVEKLIIKRTIDSNIFKDKFVIRDGELITITIEPLLWGDESDIKASQLIEFSSVKFRTDHISGSVFKNNTIIRTSFVNCDFVGIPFTLSNRHLQSLYFINCNIRDWKGVWLEVTDGLYDVKFNTCLVESGEDFLKLSKGEVNGIAMLAIDNCCIEGMKGTAIQFTGAVGISVMNSYFENNKKGDIVSLGSAVSDNTDYGVNIENNFMYADASEVEENIPGEGYWHIVLFKTIGSNICGNVCTGKLAYLKSSISDIDFHNFVSNGLESNRSNMRGITKIYHAPDTTPPSVNYDVKIKKGSVLFNNNFAEGSPYLWLCVADGDHDTAIWKPFYTSTIAHKGISLNGNEDLNASSFRTQNAIYFPVPQASWLTTGTNFPTTDRGMLDVLYSNNGATLDCVQKYTAIHDGDSIARTWIRRYLGYTGGWTAWVRTDNQLATTTSAGVMKQSAGVANITQADLTAILTANATDQITTQALVNDIKAWINTNLVPLVNANKATMNSKLTADRNSDQQAG